MLTFLLIVVLIESSRFHKQSEVYSSQESSKISKRGSKEIGEESKYKEEQGELVSSSKDGKDIMPSDDIQ